MTRSLEGKTFFFCSNNGVTAVVSGSTLSNIELCRDIAMRLGIQCIDSLVHIPTTPVFTFAREERQEKDPWITGTREIFKLLQQYVRDEGGWFGDASFYVPFSNAAELGVHGIGAQHSELRFVTHDAQFKDVFGISLQDLERGQSSR